MGRTDGADSAVGMWVDIAGADSRPAPHDFKGFRPYIPRKVMTYLTLSWVVL